MISLDIMTYDLYYMIYRPQILQNNTLFVFFVKHHWIQPFFVTTPTPQQPRRVEKAQKKVGRSQERKSVGVGGNVSEIKRFIHNIRRMRITITQLYQGSLYLGN